MNFPSKVTSYKQSVLYILPKIINQLNQRDLTPLKLFNAIKQHENFKGNIVDFMDALDCLFAIKKIILIEGVVLHYVEEY